MSGLSYETFFKIAGISIETGKAKRLVESSLNIDAMHGDSPGFAVYTNETEGVLVIGDLSSDTSPQEWEHLWRKMVPLDVQEYLSTENPSEGEPAGQHDMGDIVGEKSTSDYFSNLVRTARRNMKGVPPRGVR